MNSIQSFISWVVNLVRGLIAGELAAHVEEGCTQAFTQIVEEKKKRLDVTLETLDYSEAIPVPERDQVRARVLDTFRQDLIDLNVTFTNLVTQSGPVRPEEAQRLIAATPFASESSETSSAAELTEPHRPRAALSDERSPAPTRNGSEKGRESEPPVRPGGRKKGNGKGGVP